MSKISNIKRIWYLNKKVFILYKLLGIEEYYYKKWIEKNECHNWNKIRDEITNFLYQPKISILLPVYKVEIKYLKECLTSVENQYYQNWEICIVDDCSENQKIESVLREFANKHKDKVKLRFRQVNGHISEATNDALKLATGEYILLLDNDDIISSTCLYEVVKVINKDRSIDLLYSNEDKIDNSNRFYPYFKPEWKRKILKIDNYISHVGVYRRSIAEKIGGFTKGLEGAQDWDFALRFTQQTNRVTHIPKFLYHWRYVDTSTSKCLDSKPYARDAREKVCEKIRGGVYD